MIDGKYVILGHYDTQADNLTWTGLEKWQDNKVTKTTNTSSLSLSLSHQNKAWYEQWTKKCYLCKCIHNAIIPIHSPNLLLNTHLHFVHFHWHFSTQNARNYREKLHVRIFHKYAKRFVNFEINLKCKTSKQSNCLHIFNVFNSRLANFRNVSIEMYDWIFGNGIRYDCRYRRIGRLFGVFYAPCHYRCLCAWAPFQFAASRSPSL